MSRVRFLPTSPRMTAGWVLLAAIGLGACGCGDSGPARHAISGEALYQGEPIPAGEIIFEPDESKGLKGRGGLAVIKQGRFETLPNSRLMAGPHVVSISAFDGTPHEEEPDEFPYGTGVLFRNYQTTIVIPEKDSSHNFDVPEQD